jgi:hypothetical protein
MAWAGWGAGPAGAGAAGGPSRWILVLLLLLCAVATVVMALTGNWLGAGVGVLAIAWFVARIFLGVGRRPPDDEGPRPPSA